MVYDITIAKRVADMLQVQLDRLDMLIENAGDDSHGPRGIG